MVTTSFYPTPSDIKCYINGIELDDMFRIDFKRDLHHQPIYGYDDQQFGFAAKGKELVTGQLILNFRYPGYLRAVISEAVAANRRALRSVQSFFRTDPEPLVDPTEDAALDSLEPSEAASYLANTLHSKLASHEDTIETLKKRFKERYLPDRTAEDRFSAGMSSPNDMDFPNITFDMTVRYGFQDIDAGFRRVFKDCVLIGESSIFSAAAGAGNDMSSSAQPIFEVYPFFCKTIHVAHGSNSKRGRRLTQPELNRKHDGLETNE